MYYLFVCYRRVSTSWVSAASPTSAARGGGSRSRQTPFKTSQSVSPCWQCCYKSSHFLSPPNEVSEGTMKRAPYVCVCVRACVRAQNVEICFFSVISWPILILFVLSDRAWCGLQNLYTEFWNSLIMQIYANLFKISENATSLSLLGRFWFCLFYLIGLGAGFKSSTQNFEIH